MLHRQPFLGPMAMATKSPQPSHLLDVSISTVTAAVSVFLFTDPHPWFKGQWQWIYTNIPDCDMKDQWHGRHFPLSSLLSFSRFSSRYVCFGTKFKWLTENSITLVLKMNSSQELILAQELTNFSVCIHFWHLLQNACSCGYWTSLCYRKCTFGFSWIEIT